VKTIFIIDQGLYKTIIVQVYTKYINLRYWLGLRVLLTLHSTIFQLYLGS